MIVAIGSAVGRRVWTELIEGRPIYPNFFVFLVGPPSVGKTEAMSPVAEHLRKSDTVRLAPNDVSKQGLLDKLSKATQVVNRHVNGELRVEEYHYLAIFIRELSNFMSQYDAPLAGILTDLYDNPPVNDETKRGNGDTVIVRPSISMLAATATKNLGATISGDLWGQGFMSRIIMVYSGDKPRVKFFQKNGVKRDEYCPAIVDGLAKVGAMRGEMFWAQDAGDAFNTWIEEGMRPAPTHSKLGEYNGRRYMHVAKLAIVSALNDLRMEITLGDFLRAREWLVSAERDMPEIFKEMAVHSDGEVIRELHMHLWSIYARTKKPLDRALLVSFLSNKVASREIPRLIEAMEGGALIDRMAGTDGLTAKYIPKLLTAEIGDDIV